jgi:hypothetical protein
MLMVQCNICDEWVCLHEARYHAWRCHTRFAYVLGAFLQPRQLSDSDWIECTKPVLIGRKQQQQQQQQQQAFLFDDNDMLEEMQVINFLSEFTECKVPAHILAPILDHKQVGNQMQFDLDTGDKNWSDIVRATSEAIAAHARLDYRLMFTSPFMDTPVVASNTNHITLFLQQLPHIISQAKLLDQVSADWLRNNLAAVCDQMSRVKPRAVVVGTEIFLPTGAAVYGLSKIASDSKTSDQYEVAYIGSSTRFAARWMERLLGSTSDQASKIVNSGDACVLFFVTLSDIERNAIMKAFVDQLGDNAIFLIEFAMMLLYMPRKNKANPIVDGSNLWWSRLLEHVSGINLITLKSDQWMIPSVRGALDLPCTQPVSMAVSPENVHKLPDLLKGAKESKVDVYLVWSSFPVAAQNIFNEHSEFQYFVALNMVIDVILLLLGKQAISARATGAKRLHSLQTPGVSGKQGKKLILHIDVVYNPSAADAGFRCIDAIEGGWPTVVKWINRVVAIVDEAKIECKSIVIGSIARYAIAMLDAASIIHTWMVQSAEEKTPKPEAINSDRAQAHRFLQLANDLTRGFARLLCDTDDAFDAITLPTSLHGLSLSATLFLEAWFGSGLQYRHDVLSILFATRRLEVSTGVTCPDAYAPHGLLNYRNKHAAKLQRYLEDEEDSRVKRKITMDNLYKRSLISGCQLLIQCKRHASTPDEMYARLHQCLQRKTDQCAFCSDIFDTGHLSRHMDCSFVRSPLLRSLGPRAKKLLLLHQHSVVCKQDRINWGYYLAFPDDESLQRKLQSVTLTCFHDRDEYQQSHVDRRSFIVSPSDPTKLEHKTEVHFVHYVKVPANKGSRFPACHRKAMSQTQPLRDWAINSRLLTLQRNAQAYPFQWQCFMCAKSISISWLDSVAQAAAHLVNHHNATEFNRKDMQTWMSHDVYRQRSFAILRVIECKEDSDVYRMCHMVTAYHDAARRINRTNDTKIADATRENGMYDAIIDDTTLYEKHLQPITEKSFEEYEMPTQRSTFLSSNSTALLNALIADDEQQSEDEKVNAALTAAVPFRATRRTMRGVFRDLTSTSIACALEFSSRYSQYINRFNSITADCVRRAQSNPDACLIAAEAILRRRFKAKQKAQKSALNSLKRKRGVY